MTLLLRGAVWMYVQDVEREIHKTQSVASSEGKRHRIFLLRQLSQGRWSRSRARSMASEGHAGVLDRLWP